MSDNPFLNSFVPESEAPAPKKAARTPSAAPSASQSEKDQETLLALKTELEKNKRGLEEDTAALATTTDPKYRKELEARIPSYTVNINSVNKELARHPLGKTMAASATAGPATSKAEPGFLDRLVSAFSPSAPASAAASEASKASATTPAAPASATASAPAKTSSNPYLKDGTWVDEKDEKPKPKDSGPLAGPEHVAAVVGGVAGALAGKEAEIDSSGRAAKMMERMYGLKPGSLAELEQIKNPNAPLTDADAAKILAEKQLPDVPVRPAAAVTPEVTDPSLGPTSEQTTRILQGGEGDTKGTTGRARQEGYNIQTAQAAAIKAQLETLMRGGMSELDARAYLAKMPGLTATDSGVITTRTEPRPTAGPRFSPSVWRRERAIGPPPWVGVAADSTDLRPSFVTPKAAPSTAAPGALPASPAPAPEAAPPLEQMRAKLEENIRRAGGMSNIAQRGANLGLNTFAGAMGGYQGLRGLMDMYAHGVTPQNALETTAGAGALTGVKYPKVGLPVAGAATMGQAGLNMQKQGPTAQNVAQGVSGAGMAIMPRNAPVGLAMQAPALTLEMREWLAAHPDWWKRINAFQTPAQAPQ